MSNILFLAPVFLSICAAFIAILIPFQLHNKYRLNYLSTYLYFQIFINVFGIYGILGQEIVKKILREQASSFQTIETIGHFFSFLGLPFLILGWYMFMRLCSEIIERKLSRIFHLSYFFLLTLFFLGYGIIIILLNISEFRVKQYILFSNVLTIFFVAIESTVLIIAIFQLLLRTKDIKDKNKQRAIRTFALLNLTVYSVRIALFLFANRSEVLASIYLPLFFMANILPILYWKAYLKKYFIAPPLQRTDTLTLKQFLEEYKISKREEEVIWQLCEGKTNKEISETLFISLQTVKDHIYRIYQKTDVKNRVQLINLIQSCRQD